MDVLFSQIDGLLEGHEPRWHQWLMRIGLLLLYVLSIITAFLPFGYVSGSSPAANGYMVLHGVTILGLVVILFLFVRWYRSESMHPKAKYTLYLLMLIIFLSDIATLGDIAEIASYSAPPTPSPETPVPETFAPNTLPPTPAPHTPAPITPEPPPPPPP
eukprot:TRINITY_DN2498_c0_g1_i1.p1 TRINITY_DN2498_c0_g1~~TRINITY_DN2498_c0_g1_i1.p1  ORF type:complete len:159 (+),score=24.24 TRINITY_DN2498_c0_g1_i1:85-561(+)